MQDGGTGRATEIHFFTGSLCVYSQVGNCKRENYVTYMEILLKNVGVYQTALTILVNNCVIDVHYSTVIVIHN